MEVENKILALVSVADDDENGLTFGIQLEPGKRRVNFSHISRMPGRCFIGKAKSPR